METCRMCGATVNDKEELQHHAQLMHPNMAAGKKGGLKGAENEVMPKPEEERPID